MNVSSKVYWWSAILGHFADPTNGTTANPMLYERLEKGLIRLHAIKWARDLLNDHAGSKSIHINRKVFVENQKRFA